MGFEFTQEPAPPSTIAALLGQQRPLECFYSCTRRSVRSPLPPANPTPATTAQFTADSARSRLNLLYTLLSFYCLMPYITMGLYTADKKFYLSDASSQLYRPAAYYVAKVRPRGLPCLVL